MSLEHILIWDKILESRIVNKETEKWNSKQKDVVAHAGAIW